MAWMETEEKGLMSAALRAWQAPRSPWPWHLPCPLSAYGLDTGQATVPCSRASSSSQAISPSANSLGLNQGHHHAVAPTSSPSGDGWSN